MPRDNLPGGPQVFGYYVTQKNLNNYYPTSRFLPVYPAILRLMNWHLPVSIPTLLFHHTPLFWYYFLHRLPPVLLSKHRLLCSKLPKLFWKSVKTCIQSCHGSLLFQALKKSSSALDSLVFKGLPTEWFSK